MTVSNPFVTLFSSIPHVNFNLKSIRNLFNLDLRGEYVQSLAVLAIACITINVLLVLTIVIAWICQCCLADPIIVRNRSSVRRMSTVLLIFSVITCFLLGFTLIGNEQVNRGIIASVDSMVDAHRHISLVKRETRRLNDTCQNSTVHFKTLVNWMNRQTRELQRNNKPINQTQLNEVNVLLSTLYKYVEQAIDGINGMHVYIEDGTMLETSARYGARIENERWMTTLLLLLICLSVLVIGVFAFSRISKRAIVFYASLGMVIFILVWMLIAVILPSTVALSDFCLNGRQFIHAQVTQPLYELLDYYRTCPDDAMKKTTPRFLYLSRITDFIFKMLNSAIEANFLLQKIYIDDFTINNFSAVIIEDAATALKHVGSVEVQLDCNIFKQDIQLMYEGTCNQAIFGVVTMCLSMLLLGIILFGILMVVPRTWYIFRKYDTLPRLPCFNKKEILKTDLDHFYPSPNTNMLQMELDDNVFKCEPCNGIEDCTSRHRNSRLDSMMESAILG